MSDSEPAPMPTRRPNGARALATLERLLVDDGWAPQPDGPAAFRFAHRGSSASFDLRAVVLVDAELLLVSAEAPTHVPPARRPAAAEYILRAGCGLYVGSLEFDLDSGVARARCGLDFEGEPLSPRLARNAIATVIRLMETYLPGLQAVVAGDDPRRALAAAEGR
ncbi:MAG: hypothetical protein OHK0015_38420 [Chloroflexi bacterium OHK40]